MRLETFVWIFFTEPMKNNLTFQHVQPITRCQNLSNGCFYKKLVRVWQGKITRRYRLSVLSYLADHRVDRGQKLELHFDVWVLVRIQIIEEHIFEVFRHLGTTLKDHRRLAVLD